MAAAAGQQHLVATKYTTTDVSLDYPSDRASYPNTQNIGAGHCWSRLKVYSLCNRHHLLLPDDNVLTEGQLARNDVQYNTQCLLVSANISTSSPLVGHGHGCSLLKAVSRAQGN